MIEKRILKVLIEYLERIKIYLFDKFFIESYIYVYDYNDRIIPEKYEHYKNIIFVQKINNIIYENIMKKYRNKNVFLLNTEQMTNNKYKSNLLKDISRYKIKYLIDYSMENINILRNYIKAKIYHFPFPLKINMEKIARNKPHPERNKDIITLLNSKYRKSTIVSLEFKYVENFKGKWGNDRDELIKKSKILLNIHFDEENYNVFESIRCYNAMEYQTLIVSEPSFDISKILLKDCIIFADKTDMKNKIKDIIHNYQTYHRQIFNKHKIEEIDKRIYNVYKKNIDLIGLLDK